MNKHCQICLGIGWVCAMHPHRSWNKQFGCICGTGIPCACNQGDEFEEPDASEIIGCSEEVTLH
jgi:hypothetical protein